MQPSTPTQHPAAQQQQQQGQSTAPAQHNGGTPAKPKPQIRDWASI